MLRELQEESAFFETHRAQWLRKHKGKFALVRGSKLVGAFDTAEAAHRFGTARFGTSKFLVKQILEENPALPERPLPTAWHPGLPFEALVHAAMAELDGMRRRHLTLADALEGLIQALIRLKAARPANWQDDPLLATAWQDLEAAVAAALAAAKETV